VRAFGDQEDTMSTSIRTVRRVEIFWDDQDSAS